MNAIVVLNYNDSTNTIQFIKNHIDYSIIDYIVVVDNYSSDGSWVDVIKYASEINHPKLLLTQSCSNDGYGAGNNVGIKFAEESIDNLTRIVISNPDVLVSESDLREVLRGLTSGYDMATGLVYNYDRVSDAKSLASNYGWEVPTVKDMFINTSLVTYKIAKSIGKSNYLSQCEYRDKYIEVGCVPGCFFAIKRDVFDKVGLFDERTFLFGEENILGFKLRVEGYKTCIVNNTEILHANSASIDLSITNNKKKARIRLESELVYLKYYKKCNRLVCLLYSISYWIGFITNSIVYRIIDRR